MYRLLFLLIVLQSCKPIQETTIHTKETSVTKPYHSAFYFFTAVKTTDSTLQVSLDKVKFSEAKIKGFFPKDIPDNKKKDTHWLVNFIGNTRIYQLQIENPLIETVEYINTKANLEKKTIFHPQKTFVLRIPFQKSIKTITFEEINRHNKNFETIIISKIDL